MRVLVIGSGGREHALVRAFARSPKPPKIYCAPGNAGIAADAQLVVAAVDDNDALVNATLENKIDLVVVGPELPLVNGIADKLKQAGIACFGPSAAAAKLEGSKAYAKQLMDAAGVATASYQTVNSVQSGMDAIESYPVVIKADGLATGKGVIIAQTETEARATLEQLLVEHRFGTEKVVVEEFLQGRELSLLALCDGKVALPMAPARDYKRIFSGDQGPNTGGMGAYSPVDGVDDELTNEIIATVHQPVIDHLAQQGTPFQGVLYAGLMLTDRGVKVLEFNVRFGDPELQAILPRLESDLLPVLQAATQFGGLAGSQLDWSPQTAVTLVMASAGYPRSTSTGDPISGLEQVDPQIEITHAATKRSNGQLVTAGGRVLNVTAVGDDINQVRAAAYRAADQIKFAGKQVRDDIGLIEVNKS